MRKRRLQGIEAVLEQQQRVAPDALQHDLRGKRHLAQAQGAEPSVDERPGQADEPHHQGGDRQILLSDSHD